MLATITTMEVRYPPHRVVISEKHRNLSASYFQLVVKFI